MFDFIVLVSAIFGAAVIYAAVIALMTVIENRGLFRNEEDLCKNHESDAEEPL